MDVWISIGIAAAALLLQAGGMIVAVAIAMGRTQRHAQKIASDAQASFTAALNEMREKVSKEIAEMREKFVSELAVLKIKMEHGEAIFEDTKHDIRDINGRLRQLEIEHATRMRATGQVKTGN